MRAAAVAVVLVLAKGAAIAGRPFTASAWLVPALIWQDIAVAVAFGIVDRIARRSRVMWLPYWAIAIGAAIGVPIVRVLASPLTVPMLRAAGGALRDSIVFYVTPVNVALMALVLVTAAIAPALVRRVPARARAPIVAAALGIAALGPVAVSKADTRGLHRNAIGAIVASAWRTGGVAPAADLRERRRSPFETHVAGDLAALRGAASGRNVLLIVLESTGAQYLRPYGAADDPMPAITRLAGRAVLFERAYASYPESIKGLFALLCSREPLVDLSAADLAATPCDPLASVLGRASYRTALFHSGRFAYLGMDEVVARQGFATAEDAGAIGGERESSFGVDEPSAVRRILSWVDAQPADAPFFVAYLPAAGHHPYVAPGGGPFTGGDALTAYKNALYDGDRSIAALLDGLESRGRGGARTLVVVLGDHAEAFGQHDGNIGHSLLLYDENVRVPLLIGVPGAAPVRVDRTASTIDVAPTILDLLGLPAPSSYEGASLLDPIDRIAFFFTDYSMHLAGLRDGCWKYIRNQDARRDQLFDLCADPGETRDVAPAHADRVAAYRARVR